MASQSQEPKLVEAQRITFQVERFASSAQRIVVIGRWYGVRGRRFMRPTLAVVLRADGSERRALADLDHKPWAAEDGELWTATFPLDLSPEEAEQIELSVAPDITVQLDSAIGHETGAKRRRTAAAARAPRVRGDRMSSRPSVADRSREIEDLRTRLRDMERAHERERVRRETAESTLETERAQALELRSEAGRLRAELDLAEAAHQQLDSTAAELQSARAELRQAEQRLDQTETDLQESDRRRMAVRSALEKERTEGQRLRHELANAEAAMRRLAHEPVAPSPVTPTPTPVRGGEPSPAAAPEEPSAPSQLGRQDVLPPDQRMEPMSPRLRALNKLESTAPPWLDRPINPALRPTENWVVRVVAVVVVLAALLAVVLVLTMS